MKRTPHGHKLAIVKPCQATSAPDLIIRVRGCRSGDNFVISWNWSPSGEPVSLSLAQNDVESEEFDLHFFNYAERSNLCSNSA